MNAVLGIETATDVCSVGLSRAGCLVGVVSIRESRKHSEMLVPLIQSLLEDSGCDREELVAIALSSGPGSYTGLRIGASTAKGIAAGLEIELIAVPTLDALAVGALAEEPLAGRTTSQNLAEGPLTGQATPDAATASDATTTSGATKASDATKASGATKASDATTTSDAPPTSHLGAIVSILPARRSEVYARVYTENGGELTPAAPTEALELSALVDHMSETFGDHWVLAAPAPDQWKQVLPATVKTIEVAASAANVLSAAARHGHSVDAETFEPYYIKSFIARKPGKSAFDRLVF